VVEEPIAPVKAFARRIITVMIPIIAKRQTTAPR
jgi:hypothetical protein